MEELEPRQRNEEEESVGNGLIAVDLQLNDVYIQRPKVPPEGAKQLWTSDIAVASANRFACSGRRSLPVRMRVGEVSFNVDSVGNDEYERNGDIWVIFMSANEKILPRGR